VSPTAQRPLRREEVYPGAVVDGRELSRGGGARWGRRLQRLLATGAQRAEAELEEAIRSQPGVTRPNTVAVVSPKGGVGKTTTTFLVGNLLAGHLGLRVIAVDFNPDFGTLGALAPDSLRAERSQIDLLTHMSRLRTAAELGPYVSRLPTGLHLLASDYEDPKLSPERYGELLAYLSIFYDVVLLDCGTGITDPLARFAVERADQVMLVTTPEWVTSSVVLQALEHLHHERLSVVVNKSLNRAAEVQAIEQRFRAKRLRCVATLPYDERLETMLDSGTYSLGALGRGVRVCVKGFGKVVAEGLV
jgi:MinD-like ATPase involved in chromosome partitioning or flagellar assembly